MRPIAMILLTLGAAACASGGSSSTGPTGGGSDSTGSLAVTVAATSGITPSVTVVGPLGYWRTITSTQTLTGLKPGSYSVNAATVGTADPIVGTPYTGAVTGSPATVTAGGTATASVTYATQGGHGLLWVANNSANSAAFTTSQLAVSGSPTPSASVNTDQPASMAIDASGGVWTAPGSAGDTLATYYTQAQLLAGGTPRPTIVLLDPSRPALDVTALALDVEGNLWVAGQYSNSIAEYSRSAIATSGTPTATVMITAVFGSLARPFSLAFDVKGDLWVGNVGDSSVVAYAPSQLSAGGGQVPFAAVTETHDLEDPVALAFDAAGDLWVGAFNGSTIAEFTPDHLTSVGSPSATVVLTLAHSGIAQSLAFDASGDLWVADLQNNVLDRFAPSQLTASGSPTPATVISPNGSSIVGPYGLAFYPSAANLPVR